MLYKLLLLFCLYLPFQIALNPAEGVDLASGRVFIILLFLLWLIDGLKNKKLFIPFKIQTFLILSFLFIAGFSLFWAENLDWGVRKFLFLISIFPVYFVASGLFHSSSPQMRGGIRQLAEGGELKDNLQPSPSPLPNRGGVVGVVKFIVWGAGIAAIIGIIQFLLQFVIGLDTTAALWRNYVTPVFLGKSFTQAVLEYPSWLVNIGGRDYLRAFATFPDPHMFSFYLGLCLPLAVGLYYVFKKNIYLMLSVIILLADLLTFSRGGYVGLAAGLIFIILYLAINKKVSVKKLSVSFVLVLILLVSLVFTPVGKRFCASFSASEGSNKGRFENWNQAVEVIKNNLPGVGIGNYSYEIEPGADYRKPIYAHNLYLDIAAETGIVNSVIFMLLLIFSVWSFIVRAKNSILCLGAAAGLVIFSIHSVFDTALYSVQVLPLLLIVAAISVKK